VCHNVACHSVACNSAKCYPTEGHSVVCYSAEYYSAECHSAECCGINGIHPDFQQHKKYNGKYFNCYFLLKAFFLNDILIG